MDISGLQKRLRYVSAQYEHARKRAKAEAESSESGEGVSDNTKRIAFMHTLEAVIIHLKAQINPGWHHGDTHLLEKLQHVLFDTERASYGKPPPKLSIEFRRATA